MPLKWTATSRSALAALAESTRAWRSSVRFTRPSLVRSRLLLTWESTVRLVETPMPASRSSATSRIATLRFRSFSTSAAPSSNLKLAPISLPPCPGSTKTIPLPELDDGAGLAGTGVAVGLDDGAGVGVWPDDGLGMLCVWRDVVEVDGVGLMLD